MRKLSTKTLAIPLFIVGVCATFQNCDAGFHYDPTTQELSSSGTGNDLTGVFGIVAYSPGGTSQLASTTAFDTGVDYEVRATGSTTASALLTFTINDSASSASCVLGATGTTTKRTIKCLTTGSVRVDLKAIWPDATISSVSLTKSVSVTATATPPTNPTDNVTFRIVSGTAGSPWNMLANPIRVFVGQTLAVSNDDSVNHQIHANGQPFNMPGVIAPNTTQNIPITSAHPLAQNDLYDQGFGTNAAIYIEALDGAALYGKATGPGSCASCHGAAAATSEKRGSSFTSIKAAITGNQGGMGGITLSDQELRAIAYVLNK